MLIKDVGKTEQGAYTVIAPDYKHPSRCRKLNIPPYRVVCQGDRAISQYQTADHYPGLTLPEPG